ncbi:hypothetical protein ACIRD3_27030 [Kitasatospora sp. NPDC093550]|uniref:hypothetical protein n=1 Tax=Kitasatospora sp. NPDC093550 TaxID=3364089 RepID=UPI0037FE609E
MESTSRNSGPSQPDSARAALDAVADARALVADRVRTPWWYHLGLGAALAAWFVSMSLRAATWGTPAFVLVVLGLAWALRESTGVSFAALTATPATRRLYAGYLLALVVLAAAGMSLEWGADVRWAIAAAGLVIGALTVAVGYRADAAARRDIRAGR